MFSFVLYTFFLLLLLLFATKFNHNTLNRVMFVFDGSVELGKQSSRMELKNTVHCIILLLWVHQ